MSLPSNTSGQSSIRNFFRPRQPTYVAPPSSRKDRQPTTPAPAPPPPTKAASTAPTPIPTPTGTATAAPQPAATAAPSRPASLHPQASIARIRPEHVAALRRITSLLLPVNYPDSFYAALADPHSSGAFSRVILWRDDKKSSKAPAKVIGGLVCRPEPSPFHAGAADAPRRSPRSGPTARSDRQPNALYIQSLVLLSPYRGLGLAAALLDEVVADAARSRFACETVWAHVWTQNDEGLQWYTARGFARVEQINKYYHKLRPDSAWVVRRDIGPAAVLGLDGARSGADAPAEAGTAGPGASVTAAVANLPLDTSSSSASPRITPPPPVDALATTGSHPASRPPPNPLPQSTQGTPGQSYQNARPKTEWNDLPPEMQLHKSGSGNLSVPGTGSGASSRSSSAARKKRDRAYPAAAFGN
ncbi:acyl-CoA N-acyltransferase [Xylaria palmicola]|nr:acyl-CoA N-acyltransferase [Xylaria palmicola]